MPRTSYVSTTLAPGLIERRYVSGKIVHRSTAYGADTEELVTLQRLNRTEAKEAHRQHQIDFGGKTKGGKLDVAAPRTLGEALDRVLVLLDEEVAEGLLAKGTVYNHRNAIAKRIKPHPIVRTKLRDLDDDNCTIYLRWLLRQSCSDWTKHGTVTALQTTLRIARHKKWMTHDPLAAIDRDKYFPAQQGKQTRALTIEQSKALLAAVQSETFRKQADTDYSNIILVNRYEAHRSSETCGLHWRDVDFQSNALSVSGQLSRGQKTSEPIVITAPKNGKDGVRAPVMFPETRAALLRQREIEFAKGLARPDDLVFTKADGTPITRHNLLAAVKRAAELAGFTATTRQLRTSFLTSGVESGLTALELSSRSGNSPAVIQRFYLDPLRTAEQQQATIERMRAAGF